MAFRVLSVRQRNNMVEVFAGGQWRLACSLDWVRPSVLPRPDVVGEFVKLPRLTAKGLAEIPRQLGLRG